MLMRFFAHPFPAKSNDFQTRSRYVRRAGLREQAKLLQRHDDSQAKEEHSRQHQTDPIEPAWTQFLGQEQCVDRQCLPAAHAKRVVIEGRCDDEQFGWLAEI